MSLHLVAKSVLTISSADNVRENENHQLIDDESEEESEEDDEDEMIMPGEGDESLEQSTLQFTLDPQTHQMLQGGEQVVVFEVVQMPGGESGNEGDGTTTYVDNGGLMETPKKATIITKKALRNAALMAAQTNGASTSSGKFRFNSVRAFDANQAYHLDNIIIQLQAEDDEAASAIQSDNIIDDPDFSPSKSIKIASLPTTLIPPAALPPPVAVEDTRTIRDQLQKQKDMAECFGFKDDDDEDEAILSMPAAHAQ